MQTPTGEFAIKLLRETADRIEKGELGLIRILSQFEPHPMSSLDPYAQPSSRLEILTYPITTKSDC